MQGNLAWKGACKTKEFRSTAVAGKYAGDLVLVNFIPACAGCGVIGVHKGRVKVACKCIAFVEDQGHAVIAVTGRVQKLPIQPEPGQESTAVFQPQVQVVRWLDFQIGQGLAFEIITKRANGLYLGFGQDELEALILQLLYQSGMVRVEMSDKQILELADRNPFPLQHFFELRQGSRPAAVYKQFSIFDIDGVIVCGGISNVEDVHDEDSTHLWDYMTCTSVIHLTQCQPLRDGTTARRGNPCG